MSLLNAKQAISAVIAERQTVKACPVYLLTRANLELKQAKGARKARVRDKSLFVDSFEFHSVIKRCSNRWFANLSACERFAETLFHATGHHWTVEVASCGLMLHTPFRTIRPYFWLSITPQGGYLISAFYLDIENVSGSNLLNGAGR